jgi:hypothetical protein
MASLQQLQRGPAAFLHFQGVAADCPIVALVQQME